MGAARDMHDDAIRLYNAGDVKGFFPLHAEDAVVVTPSGTVHDRDAIPRLLTRSELRSRTSR